MTQHLTSRFWQCAVLGWGGVLFAVLVKQVEPLGVGMPFLWAIVFSFVDGWWPRAEITSIQVSSERLIEGDELVLEVTVAAAQAVPWIEVEAQLPAGLSPVGSLRMVEGLTAGTPRTFRFTMTAERWGVTGPEWVTIVARDRLGLTERVQHVAIAHRVRVHPPTERLTSLIPLAITRQVTGDHRSIRRGVGTELAEVRPYRSGDPIRTIHTRLSARRGTPMVLERHPDESADIIIFVDSVQDIGTDLDTSLRWTVTAAIALSKRHLRSMDRVGILDRGAGVRWFPPELGRRALHTIVDSLLSTAVLRPRSDDQQIVPVHRIPSGATVFCISPLISVVVRQDLVVLRQRGHEVIVIQPQLVRETETETGLAARVFRVSNEIKRQSLSEQGIVIIPWNPHEPLEPALGRIGQNLGRFRGTP